MYVIHSTLEPKNRISISYGEILGKILILSMHVRIVLNALHPHVGDGNTKSEIWNRAMSRHA